MDIKLKILHQCKEADLWKVKIPLERVARALCRYGVFNTEGQVLVMTKDRTHERKKHPRPRSNEIHTSLLRPYPTLHGPRA